MKRGESLTPTSPLENSLAARDRCIADHLVDVEEYACGGTYPAADQLRIPNGALRPLGH
jgi:hypothetical protein